MSCVWQQRTICIQTEILNSLHVLLTRNWASLTDMWSKCYFSPMCFVVFLLQCLVINICLRFLLIPQTQTKRQHITMGFRLCYIYSFNICNNMPSWCGCCCCCSSFVLLNRPLTGLTSKKDNRAKKKYWPFFYSKNTLHTQTENCYEVDMKGGRKSAKAN